MKTKKSKSIKNSFVHAKGTRAGSKTSGADFLQDLLAMDYSQLATGAMAYLQEIDYAKYKKAAIAAIKDVDFKKVAKVAVPLAVLAIVATKVHRSK